MISLILNNIVRFIILVLIQLLILNNVQFSGYANPFIYILFILMLPFETPGWLIIIIGFFTGFTIDIFSGTIGIHTSATTFAAYMRPHILKLFSPREGYEKGTMPTLKYYDLQWLVKYTVLLILIHHTFLFFIEVFRFSGFISTLLRILFSSVFTFILVILSHLIFVKK